MKMNPIFKKLNHHLTLTNLIRAVLIVSAFVYVMYGIYFRTSSQGLTDLFPNYQRFVAAFLLLSIFAGSFWSEYVKNNLISFCIYFSTFASLQMILFLHQTNYPAQHANAMVVVAILINLFYTNIKPLIIHNIIFLTAIYFSVLTAAQTEVHRYHYLIIITSVVLISFVLATINHRQGKKIKEQKDKYRELVDNTPDFIYSLDKRGQLLAVNNSFAEALLMKKEDILGKKLSELDLNNDYLQEYEKNLNIVLTKKEKVKTEINHALLDNQKSFYEIELIPILDNNNEIVKVRGMNREITQRKEAEEKIKYKSYHDELTDLYNRSFFVEELNRLDTERQLPLSIIIGDVNALKLVNDAFGHDKGDEYLTTIAKIIKKCCRTEDIIARWGGDEFVILLPQTKKSVAKEIAQRIKSSVAEADFEPVVPSIALGHATKNRKDEDVKIILQKAEDLMYQNKLRESDVKHEAIINSLINTLQESSPENHEHCQRLIGLAKKLGKKLNLSEKELADLKLLAEMHDIGKVAIPGEIIEKEKELSNEERKILKQHTKKGYQLIKSIPYFSKIAKGILHHHENWDGTGYPHQFKGEEIPYLARIIKVINEYDKLTHYHPHVERVSQQEAINKLKIGAGKEFDPYIVETFIQEVL